MVLTGRGRAFSAGGDFHVMTRVQQDEDFRERNVAEARAIITGMVRFPAPVIAAVNGPAGRAGLQPCPAVRPGADGGRGLPRRPAPVRWDWSRGTAAPWYCP